FGLIAALALFGRRAPAPAAPRTAPGTRLRRPVRPLNDGSPRGQAITAPSGTALPDAAPSDTSPPVPSPPDAPPPGTEPAEAPPPDAPSPGALSSGAPSPETGPSGGKGGDGTKSVRTRLVSLVAGNMAARVGALASLGVATVLVARVGGPELVGALTLGRILPGLLCHLSDGGLPAAAPYFLARHRDQSAVP